MRWSIVVALLLPVLLIAHLLCYQVALPVAIDMQGHTLTIHVGSQPIVVPQTSSLRAIQFAPHSPVVHEYQLDGSDSTNNFTLDPAYLTSLSTSPYYRFQAWMRDLDGTSRWRNLHVSANSQPVVAASWPENGQSIAFQPTTSFHLSVELQRPEAPMEIDLTAVDQTILHIKLDRNNHVITVTRDNLPVANVYFPVDTASFAAMIIDFFVLTTLWAICLLLLVVLGDIWVDVLRNIIIARRRNPVGAGVAEDVGQGLLLTHPVNALRASFRSGKMQGSSGSPVVPTHKPRWGTVSPTPRATQRVPASQHRLSRPYGNGPLHPIAWVALAASFLFVSWIALVQYHAQPHIYDAVAYLFAAKMYATGHLSVPVPPAADRFPGPFMVQFQGRWFTQYPPGTALTLVPGVWLGVSWLIEPLLGTLALVGIGLIAARLYNRTTATIAVLLGVLSPFYSYLAASYLSHAIALFYLVWGVWALLRFLQGKQAWNILLSAVLFGMAGLTRDLVAVLFICIIVPGLLLLSWKKIRQEWHRWWLPGIAFVVVLLLFLEIPLGFNKLLTDSWWTTPRSLFFSGDHWGFGQGVGFYGQHTPAAGLVNLDELLTILAIDLFGWPFYLTLAFLCMPFLTGKAMRFDWLFLICTLLMTFAWIGYFYHGIYLGPRYLYETLPFLLILTARGIITLNDVGRALGNKLGGYVSKGLFQGVQFAGRGESGERSGEPGTWTLAVARFEQTKNGGRPQGSPPPSTAAPALTRKTVSLCTLVLIGVLLACSPGYYLPRQITLYNNYSSLPPGYHLNLSAVYHQPDMHHAIITTRDYFIYQLVLFPLNDPLLHDDVIYAFASNPGDFTELHRAFPDRQLYNLEVGPDGSITYVKVST